MQNGLATRHTEQAQRFRNLNGDMQTPGRFRLLTERSQLRRGMIQISTIGRSGAAE